MRTKGTGEVRGWGRFSRPARILCLALGLLLAFGPFLTSHAAATHPDAELAVAAAVRADRADLPDADMSAHADLSCSFPSACGGLMIPTQDFVLETIGCGQGHVAPGPVFASARPVRPDIRPPIA